MHYTHAKFALIAAAGVTIKKFILSDALSFLTVIQEGSFAAAAKKSGVSPSVVSKRISRLELDLNIQLLQRSTRTLALTEIGQQFFEHCQRIDAEIQAAAHIVSETGATLSGTLRVNAPMSFGHRYLIPAIHAFMQQYPDIQIDLILGSRFANLLDNHLDLAIHIKNLPNTHALRARRIALRHTGLYAAPAYLQKHGTPLTLTDLKDHQCLINIAESAIVSHQLRHEWRFQTAEKDVLVPITGKFKANSNEALARACLQGLGIARLSNFMVTEEIKSGQLISILENYCPKDIAIHAVYPNQRHVPEKLRVFIDFLVERFDHSI